MHSWFPSLCIGEYHGTVLELSVLSAALLGTVFIPVKYTLYIVQSVCRRLHLLEVIIKLLN